MLEDTLLIAAAKNTAEGFGKLYEKYFPRLYNYIRWKVSNDQTAQDLASEVFMKVLKKIHTYEAQHGVLFSTWLFAIARNTVIDYYRTQKNISPHSEEILSNIMAQESLEKNIETLLLISQIQELLKELPDRQAEIIQLKYFADRSNKEISHMLNISEKTVSSYLSRGIDEVYQKLHSLSCK